MQPDNITRHQAFFIEHICVIIVYLYVLSHCTNLIVYRVCVGVYDNFRPAVVGLQNSEANEVCES